VYSDDLRRKLLEAHQRGEGSLPSLAARFSVSVGSAKKVLRALLHNGQMERPPGAKRGRTNKLTAEVLQGLKEGERVVTGKVSADAGGSQSQMGSPPVGF